MRMRGSLVISYFSFLGEVHTVPHARVPVAKLFRRSNEAVESAASALDIIDRRG